MKRAPDPYLRTCPWKIMFVWSPLETVLDQIEKDGTVDTVRISVEVDRLKLRSEAPRKEAA